ncbi:MAG: hypothetical protein ABSG78_20845, partial [Verrucomicrobiota bacterium]
STHRYKRILFPVLFVKEMTLICPEAPSGCQNPQEFPKGITLREDLRYDTAAGRVVSQRDFLAGRWRCLKSNSNPLDINNAEFPHKSIRPKRDQE